MGMGMKFCFYLLLELCFTTSTEFFYHLLLFCGGLDHGEGAYLVLFIKRRIMYLALNSHQFG